MKTSDPLVQRIINRIAKRSEEGIIKYNNTMESSNHSLNFWLDSAIEEALDFAVYLEKVKSLVGAKVKKHTNDNEDLGGGGGKNFNYEGTDPE